MIGVWLLHIPCSTGADFRLPSEQTLGLGMCFTIPWPIHWLTRWKSFSKALCKLLLALSNYEVLLSFYFSLSLFFFFLAQRELLSLHGELKKESPGSGDFRLNGSLCNIQLCSSTSSIMLGVFTLI